MRATLQRFSNFGLDDVLRGDVSADEAWAVLAHAPRDSPFASAIADDPELTVPPRPGPPKLAQFSPEVEALAGVYDLLAAILANVIAIGGGKPPKIDPYARPVTASQLAAKAAQDAADEALHQRLVSQLVRSPERRVRGELQRGHGLHLDPA